MLCNKSTLLVSIFLTSILTSTVAVSAPLENKPQDLDLARIQVATEKQTFIQVDPTHVAKEVLAAYPGISLARSTLAAAFSVEVMTSEGPVLVADIMHSILQIHLKTVQTSDNTSPITRIVLAAQESYVDGVWTLASKISDRNSLDARSAADIFLVGAKMNQLSIHEMQLNAAKVNLMTNLLRTGQVKTTEQAFRKIQSLRPDILLMASAELKKIKLPAISKGALILSDAEGHQVHLQSLALYSQAELDSVRLGSGYPSRLVWKTFIDGVAFDLSSTGIPEDVIFEGQKVQGLYFTKANYGGLIPQLPGFFQKQNRLVTILVNAQTGEVISADLFQSSLPTFPGEEWNLRPQ